MKGFRLISLTLDANPDYPAGHYQFSNSAIEKDLKGPFTTLILGANGTGKSRLIKLILDIFNDLYNYKRVERADFIFRHYFLLEYFLDDAIYTVEYSRGDFFCRKNAEMVKSGVYGIPLPSRGIAAAYSIYDKFSPKKITFDNNIPGRKGTRYDNAFYEYLGTKTERNFTFSGSYINRSIDLITQALAKDDFSKDLSQVFRLLNLQPRIFIRYKIAKIREIFINDIINVADFKKVVKNITFKSAGFGYNKLLELSQRDDEFLEQVVKSLREVKVIQNRNLEIPFQLVFDDGNENYFHKQRYEDITFLLSLGLIKYDKICVYKNDDGKELELKSMSSGEIQIITSMLALSSIVEHNSIVLIDEPEISLHPNWQIKFLELLTNIFKTYSSCHFMIATHSHFLVSDLRPKSSAILALIRSKSDKVEPELVEYDTYGWSAENVLYNVFGVATVRNHYFEMDLRELLKIISSTNKSKNKLKVKTYLEKLSRFNVHRNDPLSLIITEAKKYLNED